MYCKVGLSDAVRLDGQLNAHSFTPFLLCFCSVAYASEMCDVLNQDLFSPCHEYLSPVPFHQQCRSDTCKCGTACFCSALAHYARHCRRFSILIDFRSRIDDCGKNWTHSCSILQRQCWAVYYQHPI